MKHRKGLLLELVFATTAAYVRFLRELAAEVEMEKTVVRGRVTPSGAWMKIALVGDAEGVDVLRQRWRDWILAATALPPAAA